MAIYLYVDKDSFLHRLHPVTKILGLLLLFLIAMVFNHPLFLLFLLSGAFLLAAVAHALTNLRRMLPFFLLLAFFSVLLWSLFIKGPTLIYKFWIISLSRESILYGLAMGMRINMMIICGLIFLSSTRIEEFTLGLNKLGIPFPISFALSLAFRLVPTFVQTASTITQAQRSRGLDLDSGSLIQRVKKYLPLLIPIFASSIRKTDCLSMALESRGFGRPGRSYFLHFKMGWQDYITLLCLVGLNGLCLYLRLKGYGTVLGRL